MRFWLLTSEFPPLFGGGISTYCAETAQMLSRQGYQVTVFTQDAGVSTIQEEKKSEPAFRVIRFNPRRFFTRSFLGYEAHLSYAFAQLVKEYMDNEGVPDVLEAQEYMGIAYYTLQFKHLGYPGFKDLRVLLTLHAPSFLYLEYNKVIYHRLPYFWVGEMEKFCIRAADMRISPSSYLVKEVAARMELDDKPVHILNNPYRLPEQNAVLKPTGKKVVFFGKLTPQKGCLELLDYFRSLWKEGHTETLMMIGGGNHLYHPEGMDMIDFIRKKYALELKSGLLQLKGSIAPGKLDLYLSEARLVVVPSTVDNLPYTVLEAMGQGKIVLASVQGGQQEVITDGEDGFLFDHDTPASFALQLKKILALTDEQVQGIGGRAIAKITNNYAPERIYAEKKLLLDQLLQQAVTQRYFPFTRTLPVPEPLHLTETGSLLTVVLPYYNMGKYVEETIASLRRSTWKNMEIILVNDGSDEAYSLAVLEKLQETGIVIIDQENKGLAAARNAGAIQAKGQYLAFLDPDDTVEPDYYSKALEVLAQKENVFFVGCWAKYFDEANGYWPAFNPEPPFILVHNTINSSALVYKKYALVESGLNDSKMIFGMEDYESVINLVKNGYHGVVLPEPLWNYRVRKNSMARAFTVDKQLFLYRLISEKHAKFYATFAADISNILNANGSGINYDNPSVFHQIPGTGVVGLKLKQKLIEKIKSEPLLRKMAVKLKKYL